MEIKENAKDQVAGFPKKSKDPKEEKPKRK
jgi:hypothetical protein